MVTAGSEESRTSPPKNALVLWFDEVTIADIPPGGGKNASLGELIQQLAPRGISVPNGRTSYATVLHPSIWVRREAAIAIV